MNSISQPLCLGLASLTYSEGAPQVIISSVQLFLLLSLNAYYTNVTLLLYPCQPRISSRQTEKGKVIITAPCDWQSSSTSRIVAKGSKLVVVFPMCDGFKTGHDFHFNRTTGLHFKQCFKSCPCCLFVCFSIPFELRGISNMKLKIRSRSHPKPALRYLLTYSRLYFVYTRI